MICGTIDSDGTCRRRSAWVKDIAHMRARVVQCEHHARLYGLVKPHPLVVNVMSRQPYDVYVGRPGPWGNPWTHGRSAHAEFRVATREEAIALHRAWLLGDEKWMELVKKNLRGKVLGCHCAPKACHAETLAEVANA